VGTPVVRLFTGIQDANKALTVRAAVSPLVPAYDPIVMRWTPDEMPTTEESLVIVIGPDFCGYETEKKWFRGLRAFGIGQVRVMVFVDGTLIDEKLIQVIDDAAHSRLFYLPRGTKGYQIVALVAGIGGELSNVEILFDPCGSMENQ
jgi:hypothetical protein